MEYQKKVIIYIDLLGFKDFIHFTHKTANNQSGKISRVFNFFNFLKKLVDQGQSLTKSKVISHFSDLIVISFDAQDFEAFHDEIKDIQTIISNCIVNGFFVRGSVIYGEIVHTPEIIFGPGLIEAYQLETEKAVFPRVIIDETIIKDFNDVKPSKFDIEDIVNIDNDGLYYVDYFEKVRGNLDHDQQYKKYIIKMTELLFEMSKKPNLRQKLEWIMPHYSGMLASVNFFSDDGSTVKISDLWHIHLQMKSDW